MEDTWTNRDPPVLKAVVKVYTQTGQTKIPVEAIQHEAGFDERTTQLALQMLYREPYFTEGVCGYGGGYRFVGEPTGAALRVAGAWPDAREPVERLIAALEAAAEDEDREEPERSKLRQGALLLRSTAYKVAIGALGGAGGHILTS